MSTLGVNKVVGRGAAPVSAAPNADYELVRRCQQGDPAAFEELVGKYQDRIFNLVYRLIGRYEDAQDATQDVFLRALEHIADFRQQAQVYTWLFRIAVNLAVSHRRRAGRVGFRSLSGGEDGDSSLADSLTSGLAERREASPSAAAGAAELAERVRQALDDLDEEFRTVVVLRDIEEMDYGQIAQVLELPAGTVKSRLHRARGLLRVKLADVAAE